MRAAREGMVGISTTNSEPYVVPFGGAGHALGTNPIALAAPTSDGIFDVDMATSQVAVNRIFNARDEGREIPAELGRRRRRAADHRTRPTCSPPCRSAATRATGWRFWSRSSPACSAERG